MAATQTSTLDSTHHSMQSLTERIEKATARVKALPWARELDVYRITGEYSTTYSCGRFRLRASRLTTDTLVCWFVDAHGGLMHIRALGVADGTWNRWWSDEQSVYATLYYNDFDLFTRNLQYSLRHDSANPCSAETCTACRAHRIATCEARELPLDTKCHIGFVLC